ncbi:MAG: ATP-binding cassette domain-containing protein [Pseudohongiellaceae bacterium]|nr:ATP-binding cassette domain-containing protein [Pseudohongiellaceae bacterium]
MLEIAHAHCRVARNKYLSVERFVLEQGQHWCVFGGNGAGKTLFVQLLTAKLHSGRSKVTYASGFSLNDVEFVSFEEQQRLWELDARHDISEYCADAQDQGTTVAKLVLGEAEANTSYREIMGSLQLLSLQDRGIRFLSSGQMRKAQLARALYRQPKLLVMDEPLESIDSASRSHIVSALNKWMTPHNASILVCRREKDILAGVSHLLLMQDLKLVVQGKKEEVLISESFQNFRSKKHKEIKLPIAGQFSATELSPNTPLIELRDVTAGYGDSTIIDKLSWKMMPSHHTLIEGPNGCGKSTLLNLLCGENHKAYGQEVYLFGRKRGTGESVWEVKAHFGIVSNELHNKYLKSWRVSDVVVSGYYDSVGLYQEAGALEQAMALQWLSAFGLHGAVNDEYGRLSFGQQRLVLLARAMIKRPRILILDEPCVGLDDEHRRLILDAIDRIASTGGTQIIFVSHLADEYPNCINQRLSFRDTGIELHEECVD